MMKKLDRPIPFYTDDEPITDDALAKVSKTIDDIVGSECASYGHKPKQICLLARQAEQWCAKRGLSPYHRSGIIIKESRNNKENKDNIATSIVIARKNKWWYLEEVGYTYLLRGNHRWKQYYLTSEQDRLVKKWLDKQYVVQHRTFDVVATFSDSHKMWETRMRVTR